MFTSPSPDAPTWDRRDWLRAVVAAALTASFGAIAAGCAGPPARRSPPAHTPPLPPLRIAPLASLVPAAHLRFLVLARLRELLADPPIARAAAVLVPSERLDELAAHTGIDPRRVEELLVADRGSSRLYLLRHGAEAAEIERRFRARLTSRVERVAERPDVVRIQGHVGSVPRGLVLLGPDVAGFEVGPPGPARLAALFAGGKLRRSPTALQAPSLAELDRRFGAAPARALAPGPFEGEAARAAGGLLAAASAVGASARVTARDGFALTLAVAGDFSRSGAAASERLRSAWEDLAASAFGRLLGLNQPHDPPLATWSADAVAVAAEIDPLRLAHGLRALVHPSLDDLLRPP